MKKALLFLIILATYSSVYAQNKMIDLDSEEDFKNISFVQTFDLLKILSEKIAEYEDQSILEFNRAELASDSISPEYSKQVSSLIMFKLTALYYIIFYEDAIKNKSKAEQLHIYINNQAVAFDMLGKRDIALKTYQRSLNVNPEYDLARKNMEECRKNSRKVNQIDQILTQDTIYKKANEHLDQLIENYKRVPLMLINGNHTLSMVPFLMGLKYYDDAENILNEEIKDAMEEESNNLPSLIIKKAQIYKMKGEPDKVIQVFEDFLNSSSNEAHKNRIYDPYIQTLISNNEHDKAINVLRKQVEKYPLEINYIKLANVLSKDPAAKEETETIIKQIKDSLLKESKVNNEFLNATNDLLSLLISLERESEAFDLFKEIVENNFPTNTSVLQTGMIFLSKKMQIDSSNLDWMITKLSKTMPPWMMFNALIKRYDLEGRSKDRENEIIAYYQQLTPKTQAESKLALAYFYVLAEDYDKAMDNLESHFFNSDYQGFNFSSTYSLFKAYPEFEKLKENKRFMKLADIYLE